MIGQLSFWIVFIQGLASFFSPCVLPLLPAYLSYLAGDSLEEAKIDQETRIRMVVNAVGFVLGLSLVFIALGTTASAIGRFLYFKATLFRKISGIIVIFFGLYHGGILNIPWLNYEKRVQFQYKAPTFFNAFLLGVTFSFGWTPCIGGVLTSVLALASNAQTMWSGIFLLVMYSLGLGIPFVILALAFDRLIGQIRKIYQYFHIIKFVSGMLLVLMGILIYTNYLYRFSLITW